MLRVCSLLLMLLLCASAHAEILIGVAGPFSGKNAAFGQQMKAGTEAAAAAINAAGGINGEQIKLSFGDDESDPRQGVAVAQKFIADGVKYVIGHYNSGVSVPTSEIYADNNMLMITPSATRPELTERGVWNVFRICGRSDLQGQIAADYIAAHFKTAKLAILHDKTIFGKALAEGTKAATRAAGTTETIFEGVNVGDKDFSALIAKLKTANITVVYWGGSYMEYGLIRRQAANAGLNATFLAGDGIASLELTSIGGPAIEGTIMTFIRDQRKNPAAKDVAEKIRASGFEPEAYTLHSYAALQVIAAAANKFGKSDDPRAIANEIRSAGPWPTVIGDLLFNSKGDITRPDYVLYTWKKGASGDITFVENE